MQADAILALWPVGEDDDPLLWFVSGDAVTGESTLSAIAGQFDAEMLETIPATLLVPATLSTFRRVEAEGLEPKQELAVARIRAQAEALGTVQAGAARCADGRVALATVDAVLLQYGIDRISRTGLSVKAAVPFGALVEPVAGEILRAEIGGHVMLCSADLCSAEEPSLVSALFGDVAPRTLGEAELAAAMVAIARAPEPNFLEGMATRRRSKPLFSDANRLWAKRLSILAACLMLAGGIAYWAKLQWAISNENSRALAAAQKIDPTINDIDNAEAGVDAALARKGIERAKPAILVAIVWQAAKANENVAVSDMALVNNGLLSATLSAPDSDSINAALLSIQRAGYQITATPRRDSSGVTLVDLTVKAP